MQFQAKLLRRGGVRRPQAEIAAAPWVIVQIVTDSRRGGKALRMYPMKATLAMNPSPVRELFRATIEEITVEHFTYFGMEPAETHGGDVAGVAQEWMLKNASLGPMGMHEARERGITDDAHQL